MPRCDGKFGLCRYVEAGTGREVIPPRFEQAMRFSEGLAAVRIDGRFGYIDPRGEIVISPRFDLAGEFHLGLAEVVVARSSGIVSRSGRMVVQPAFRRVIPLMRTVMLVAEGNWDGSLSSDQGLLRGPIGLYHIDGYWIWRTDLRQVSVFDREGRGLVWAVDMNRNDRSDL
ncbi:MAG: WG repeat-containing protein [Hyphomicrobiales bacterium]|nr:WG repeat-containing protein [Hyphomicrobiales bacterium]